MLFKLWSAKTRQQAFFVTRFLLSVAQRLQKKVASCPARMVLRNPAPFCSQSSCLEFNLLILEIKVGSDERSDECDIASPLYNWNAAVNFPGQGQQKKQEEEVQRLLLSSSSCDWPDGYHRLLLVLIPIVIPKWWNDNPFGLLSHYGLLYYIHKSNGETTS